MGVRSCGPHKARKSNHLRVFSAEDAERWQSSVHALETSRNCGVSKFSRLLTLMIVMHDINASGIE